MSHALTCMGALLPQKFTMYLDLTHARSVSVTMEHQNSAKLFSARHPWLVLNTKFLILSLISIAYF